MSLFPPAQTMPLNRTDPYACKVGVLNNCPICIRSVAIDVAVTIAIAVAIAIAIRCKEQIDKGCLISSCHQLIELLLRHRTCHQHELLLLELFHVPKGHVGHANDV